MSENIRKKKYVLITAARDEEAYIEKTIKAVISQTILPVKWIVVSDGSIDRTDSIISRYSEKYDFIKLVSIKGDNKRNFGSQVRAIKTGYEFIKNEGYDYIGNLDADISFESDYYERILDKFRRNPMLALAGGYIHEEYKGGFCERSFNSTLSVPHGIQLFRRDCYESIGGYLALKYGGPDWCAEVMVRMDGWKVESFPEIKVYHHKPTLAADGIRRGGFRQGMMDASLGSHPLFEFFKCLLRFKMKPHPLYPFYRLSGFFWAYYCKEERMVSDEFVQFLRKEQLQRLRSEITHIFSR